MAPRVSQLRDDPAVTASLPTFCILRLGSTNGISVDIVEVGDCCSLPCYFTNGQNVSSTIVFTAGVEKGVSLARILYYNTPIQHADEYYESLTLKLCGELYGSCIDFSLTHSNVCGYVSCPLQFRKQYRMRLNVFIKPHWQNVSLGGCTVAMQIAEILFRERMYSAMGMGLSPIHLTLFPAHVYHLCTVYCTIAADSCHS